MPLPNFFVIGAPKAGTTALYRALTEHPEIYVPKLKEPHFFSYDPTAPDWKTVRSTRRERHMRVTAPLDYFRLFSEATGYKAVGEASTSYLRSKLAPQRIREQLPRQSSSRCFATRSNGHIPRTGSTCRSAWRALRRSRRPWTRNVAPAARCWASALGSRVLPRSSVALVCAVSARADQDLSLRGSALCIGRHAA